MKSALAFFRKIRASKALKKNSPPVTLVLAYHNVKPVSFVQNDLFTVSLKNFKAHLKVLCRYFQVVRPNALLEPSSAQKSPVVITFDDGHHNNYEFAFKALGEENLPATFFISPAKIGKADYLNWDQVLEMHRHGMVFGTHGLNHPDFGQLTPQETEYELANSKSELENKLSQSVLDFAYPYGNPQNMKESDKPLLPILYIEN